MLVAALATVAALFASDAAADRIYWGNSDEDFLPDSIGWANTDGSGGGVLNTGAATVDEPTGVTIDAAAGVIYWTNRGNHTISWARLDGGGGGDLATGAATVSGPSGPAIDPVSRRIYWGNTGAVWGVSWANLDGSGGGDLSTAGATDGGVNSVAIDPAANWIYWANNLGTISRARLDGSGNGSDLDTTGVTMGNPSGVAIDPATNSVYWSDYGPGSEHLARANLDGTGDAGTVNTASAAVDMPWGVAVDATENRLWWVNSEGGPSNKGRVSFARLDGTGGSNLATPGATVDVPMNPALLKTPAAVTPPVVSGSAQVGQTLSCSTGDWASDQLGAKMYRAPQAFAYQWTRDGVDISGATASTIDAAVPGAYACRVTAINAAGGTSQISAAVSVAPSGSAPPPPPPDNPPDGGNNQGNQGNQGNPTPAPQVTRTEVVVPQDGEIKVRQPGSNRFVTVTGPIAVRNGTELDTTDGTALIRVALNRTGTRTGEAELSEGVVKIQQQNSGKVNLRMTERLSCPRPSTRRRRTRTRNRRTTGNRRAVLAGAISHIAARKKARRIRIRVRRGPFQTSGSRARVHARGTGWRMTENCQLTRINVFEGRVTITDFVKKRTFPARAPFKYEIRSRFR
jgi:hypothetical protein